MTRRLRFVPLVGWFALALSGLLLTTPGVLSGQQYFPFGVSLPAGTSGAPALSYTAETTLGFWRSAAATTTHQGALTVTGTITGSGNVVAFSTGYLGWSPSKALFASPFNGVVNVSNSGATIGSQFKVDALPTAGTCGTTPAVIAGSTPLSGSINVGTATPASCIVVFGGTAFPSAPHCTANVVTSTAADTRAIGTLATTTQVTLTPATAFVDSAIVAWHCISARA